MSDAAATLTQDRQRLELSALSAPAVIFTVAMIAFPVVYTIWLGFQSFRRPASNPSWAGELLEAASDDEFWHGLWITIALYVLSLVLQLVLRHLAGAGAVSRQAAARHRALAVHFALHDAAGGGRHDVAGDPRSVARRGQLHPAMLRPAAVGLAGVADMGHSDGRADRQLAMDALRRADRARRTAVAAAERL